jgi:hypothetical protein
MRSKMKEALAICGGDAIAASRLNAFLEAEIDRLDDTAATSNFTVLAQRLDRHLVNRFPTDPSLGNDPDFRYPFLWDAPSDVVPLGCAAGCDATPEHRNT